MLIATGEFFIVNENENVFSVEVKRTLKSSAAVMTAQVGLLVKPESEVQLDSVCM